MVSIKNLGKVKGVAIALVVLVAAMVGIAFVSRAISGTNLPIAAVQSGSMEPTIPTGSLLFITYVSGEDIVAGTSPTGDVVIFYFAGEQITDYFFFTIYDPTPWSHRAIQKTMINGTYYVLTKGDHNAYPDQNPYQFSTWVPETRIIGKVAFFIPYLGYPFLWFKSPLVIAGVALILVILIIVPVGEKKEKNKIEENPEENNKAL